MSAYWDSSALIAALQDDRVMDRLLSEGGMTRPHAFAEVFSTLTGGRLGVRFATDHVAVMIRELRIHLEESNLTASQCLSAFDEAKGKGVRGGQIYDFLHATAAVLNGCTTIYTLNLSDFRGLYSELTVEEP